MKTKVRKNRPFMLYLISRMMNRFGDSIDVFLLSWLVYGLSGSASLSALAVGINYVPTILLQPFVGAYVENIPKRRVLALTDMGRALLVAVFLILHLTDSLSAAVLIAGTFLISTLEAFSSPAASAAIAGLLKKEEYDSGISMNMGCSRVMELVGTGAAGLLIALVGSSGALLADMTCFAVSALLMSRVRIAGDVRVRNAEGTETTAQRGATYLHSLRDGMRFILTSKPMILTTAVAAFLNIAVTPFNALQTALVQETYGRGSRTLSAMGICVTAGMILSAALYSAVTGGRHAKWAEKLSIDRLLVLCGIMTGSYYLVLAMLGRVVLADAAFYAVLFAASVIFGLVVGLSNTAVSVFLMRMVPSSYMARATAVLNAGCTATVPLTSFVISGICTRADVVSVFFGMAALVILAAAAMAFTGALKLLRDPDAWNEKAPA